MKVVFYMEKAEAGVFVLTPGIAIDTNPVSVFSGAGLEIGLVWFKWALFITFHF